MRTIAAVAAAALAAVGAMGTDPCAAFQDCPDCIKYVGCGWCSTDVIYQDGSKGAHCAGPKFGQPFSCLGIYSTEKCIQGYVCNNQTHACDLAPPGQGVTKAQCEAKCHVTPAPTPPPITAVYLCNTTTHKCDQAPPGTKGATSLTVCKQQCPHESPAPPGPPHHHTPAPTGGHQVYKCNETELKCNPVKPGTAGAASLAVCEASCKKTPGPPPALEGIWRGLLIQKGYAAGEIDVKFDKENVTVVSKTAVLLFGRVSASPDHFSVEVESGSLAKAGAVVKGLYAQEGQGPETGFLEVALGAADADAPESFEAAMGSGSAKVLILSKCLNEKVCTFVMENGFSSSSVAAAAVVEAIVDPCSAHGASCKECLASSAQCGWCSQKVRYHDGTVGSQCAGVNEGITPFVCEGQYSTDQCLQGFKCDHTTGKCVDAGEGEGVPLAQCKASCKVGPTPPTPPPTPPTPPTPPANLYSCNFTSLQCVKGHGSTTQKQCEQICVKPKPGPPAPLLGDWRGLQIRQKYVAGEYDLVFTNTTATLSRDGAHLWTASVATYGNVYLRFTMTDGRYQGMTLNAEYQEAILASKEVNGMTLATGAYNGGMPASFDAAMVAPLDAFVFFKCKKTSPDCKF